MYATVTRLSEAGSPFSDGSFFLSLFLQLITQLEKSTLKMIVQHIVEQSRQVMSMLTINIILCSFSHTL